MTLRSIVFPVNSNKIFVSINIENVFLEVFLSLAIVRLLFNSNFYIIPYMGQERHTTEVVQKRFFVG